MEVGETKPSRGYAKSPWLFKGSALYQLHLVRAETARAFIPKEFRLVEAFGYTLGGFFLAHYEDSPAGIFDELVVIAGIVWNPPTSCAWAARVLVNSHEACIHGRKDIGLPSQVAGFSKVLDICTSGLLIDCGPSRGIHLCYMRHTYVTTRSQRPRSKKDGLLNMIGMGTTFCNPKDRMNIQVTEIRGTAESDFCNINLPTDVSESKSYKKWMGPNVKMSLPSFSGHTDYNPHLLKYSCQIECRVRAVEPAKVSRPTPASKNKDTSSEFTSFNSKSTIVGGFTENDAWERSISVLLSKPVLALEFNFLKMQVEAPTVVANSSKNMVEGS